MLCNVASFVVGYPGAMERVIFFLCVLSHMNVPLIDLPPVNLMHNKALSSVWVALYHCESFYCYFGTTSTNVISTAMKRALGLFKWWEIKCNESNHISDSQDELGS